MKIDLLKKDDIRLEPLNERHVPGLALIANDSQIWAHNPAIRTTDEFKAIWLPKAFDSQANQTRWPLVIIHQTILVGSTSFYDYAPKHHHISIGYTWYHPNYWGSGLNKKVKKLMLDYAFNSLQCERVAFYIDSDNKRSCRAVEKLGATKEGILRHHILRSDQTYRDTVCYSILTNEWKKIKL